MNKQYIAHNIYWDGDLKKLFGDHQEIKLSLAQRKALAYMLEHPNKALQNIDIFYEVNGGFDKEFSERSVRNLVSSLRRDVPGVNIKNSYGGYYALITKPQETRDFKSDLFEILEQSKNAIAITDPNQFDNPIIYVNAAFLELFGYKREELIGNNIRLLNAGDSDQQGLRDIKAAIRAENFIEVNIRDYTKKGELIYDEITISPIFDKQRERLIYFLSIHKDVSETQLLLQKLEAIL